MSAAAARDRAGPRSALSVLAWSVGAVSVAGFAAAWVLAARNRDLADFSADFGPDRFMVAFALVGTVVAARRPFNAIGWFLLGIGLVEAARGLTGEYARRALTGPPHSTGVWAEWFVNWSLGLLVPVGVLAFLMLLFPDSRPPTRRWWPVFWIAVLLEAAFLLITWLSPEPMTVVGLPALPNPTGIHGLGRLSSGWLAGVVFISGVVVLLLTAVSVVVRYRRSTGEERVQLKWFAYAVAVSLSLIAVLGVLASPVMARSEHLIYDAVTVAGDAVVVVGIGLALPLAIGIAILKYRLYAIDKIISRTVSYVLVTGLVVGVYLGCVALLAKVLPDRGSVGVAVSVLAAAALFNPLRRRVQAAVDRRFDRARYDAERVVERFSVQLRDEVDLDVLAADLLGVVDQALAPAHMRLWLAGQPDPLRLSSGEQGVTPVLAGPEAGRASEDAAAGVVDVLVEVRAGGSGG